MDLHDAGGQTLTAPVNFISNAVSNSAGTIELRATFPNTDSSLVPGQLVDVVVALANITNAIVVPRVAVNLGPDSQYVYVVTSDHTVEQHNVKVLFDDGTDMAIAERCQAGRYGDHRRRAARIAGRQGQCRTGPAADRAGGDERCASWCQGPALAPSPPRHSNDA